MPNSYAAILQHTLQNHRTVTEPLPSDLPGRTTKYFTHDASDITQCKQISESQYFDSRHQNTEEVLPEQFVRPRSRDNDLQLFAV
ncbi:predicted protein [Botrytis cinerea T4]|uniref:Uncharacterized protein n=1 Tax=Botryotinia fuckeliana (strain T4) TaxID=999810 RepID=G2YGD9_BOTF4|nr:predicted protein [Botrytis cinerea T4]